MDCGRAGARLALGRAGMSGTQTSGHVRSTSALEGEADPICSTCVLPAVTHTAVIDAAWRQPQNTGSSMLDDLG